MIVGEIASQCHPDPERSEWGGGQTPGLKEICIAGTILFDEPHLLCLHTC
jgi:hypothetical protein